MKQSEIAFEFCQAARKHTNVETLLDDLRCRIGFFGMKHVMVAVLPTNEPDVRDLVMLNGWPREWYERYVAKRYFRTDAVTQFASRSSQPFLWSKVPAPLVESAAARTVAGEASEFGMRNGFLVPFPTARGWQSCVSFGASEVDGLSDADEAALVLLAYIANKSVREMIGEPRPISRLSEREREVVKWLSAGKTAWEISEILCISENTIEKHVRQARQKLDVVNSSQLVAEAIRRHEVY